MQLASKLVHHSACTANLYSTTGQHSIFASCCDRLVHVPDLDVAKAWLSALFLALVATEPTVPLDAPVSVPAMRPALLLASPSVRLLENNEL
jgi:hypothetical protein